MEDLNLTETEMRYFGDLFLCCDEEANGKIPILKATELFRSSNIPNDILKQVIVSLYSVVWLITDFESLNMLLQALIMCYRSWI